MRVAAVLVFVGACGCECVPPLIEVDGGTPDAADAGDAGPSDAGPDAGDAGEVVDAGGDVVDAGEPCFFPPVDPITYTPDGSEDFVDPAGDTDFADVDLLATWSRFEGDDFVIEMLFAAPPFRFAHRASAIDVGFLVGDGDPPIGLCDRSPSDDTAEPICVAPNSLVIFGDSLPTKQGWPPDEFYVRERESAPYDERDPCSHAFATRAQPFLRLRIPSIDARIGIDTPYVVRFNYSRVTFRPVEASWATPTDSIAIRGGAAPTTEPFVSVCDIECPSP